MERRLYEWRGVCDRFHQPRESRAVLQVDEHPNARLATRGEER